MDVETGGQRIEPLRRFTEHATGLALAACEFYWRCVVRAFSGKFGLAAGMTGAVSTFGLLIVAFANPGASVERLLTMSVPAIFFVSVFLTTVLISLVLAPVQLHLEEVQKRKAVEELRKPRFRVALPPGGLINLSTKGATTETMGGERQTVTTGWVSDVLCLVCENTGETAIRSVRARIMAVRKFEDDGAAAPLAITEPIELTWKKDDLKAAFSRDLAANEKCRVWLGGVRSQGQFWVYRDVSDLPIEYQQVFGRAGEYHILLQFDADDAPPLQTVLRVLASEGEKPKVSGIHRGKAEVELLAQASPTVDWPVPVMLSVQVVHDGQQA
jgi:hypothetical protein